MGITFNKREIAKRKRQRRQEKQQRREERRANARKKTFEDMIAYVDEYGVITDTPVDPTQIEEVDASSIEVSIPPMAERNDDNLRGRVNYYNEDKGYGFIKDNGSPKTYFFHISNAPESINTGQKVKFELEQSRRGLNAVNIATI